jgi:hypothetical protein
MIIVHLLLVWLLAVYDCTVAVGHAPVPSASVGSLLAWVTSVS